jgi:hypothetical protein
VGYKIKPLTIYTLTLIVFLFGLSGETKAAEYFTSGTYISSKILWDKGVIDIEKFGYNASSIPAGTTLKVQFSQDLTNWVNSLGVVNGWDDLSEGNHLAEGDAIDLSALGWGGRDFYYKVQFESNTPTEDATPVLDEVNVWYLPGIYVTTELSTYVTAGSAAGNGEIHTVDGGNASRVGFQYGLTETDTWSVYEDGDFGLGSFSLDITGLDSLTTYYVRAYTVNSRGTTYGDWVSFTTGVYYDSGSFTSTNLLWNKGVSDINKFGYNATIPLGASLRVQFSQNGSDWFSSAGVSGGWDTLLDGDHLAELDALDISALGWTGRNFYYKIQYDTNTPDNDLSSLLHEVVVHYIPGIYVTTSLATEVFAHSAVGNANIQSVAGSQASARGFKYGLSESDTWDVHETGSFGVGVYSLELSDLQPLTTYYIRAYTVNDRGTSYGDWFSFTTGGDFASSGTITSNNMLEGYDVIRINRFNYTLSSKHLSTEAKVQFSQDGTDWYNSSGVLGGYDNMREGTNSVNLLALEWDGANFYYRMELTSSTGLHTPVLEEVSVLINDPLGLRMEGVQLEGVCVGDAPCH